MIDIDGKKIHFPIKYAPKQHQIEALEFIKKSINSGKQIILLNLPTGVGKSFLSVAMFTNWYRNYINSDAKFDVITNSKVLQEQYLRDFDFMKNYKGKSNYYCSTFSCQCDTGKELCKVMKNSCTVCPYDVAKNTWISSNIGLLNFHLFSTLSIFQPDIIKSRNSNVLIVDECHDIESVYSDYLSTKISAKILKKCGLSITEIEKLDDRYLSKIKHLDKYIAFLNSKLIPTLEDKLSKFESEIINAKGKKKLELSNFVQNIEGKLLSFKKLNSSYQNDVNNVVLDVVVNKKDMMFSGVELTTSHIWVYEYISEVWKNYDHIIFMSATILDKNMFSFINGLNENMTSYYEIPSHFPLKNRPIYYMKVGKMNYNNKEETFKNMIPWIKKILAKYKNDKGIIHTTNYEITEWIKENIMNSRLLFHETEDRNDILEQHLNSKEPTVLVSPSMINGISLDDELCRFSIMIKIPYPNLSSNKIKGRQKSNPDWYSFKASADIIQSYGRSVRSETDYADTFILDSNFSDILKYNKYLPQYFIDAVKILNI